MKSKLFVIGVLFSFCLTAFGTVNKTAPINIEKLNAEKADQRLERVASPEK